jgi:hypothetical protein
MPERPRKPFFNPYHPPTGLPGDRPQASTVPRPGWGLFVIRQNRGVVLLIFSIPITWVYNRSGRGLLSALVFHGATGSFPYILPSSAPLLVPVAVVLVIAAVVSGRMWRKPKML